MTTMTDICFAYTKSQTILQLYLHANNDIFCSQIAELPFTSQFYRFELVPYAPEVTSSAVFTLLSWNRGVKISDLALYRTVDVKGTIIIPPWKAKKVIQILHHAHAEAHLLVTTGEGLTVESMILWKATTEKKSCANSLSNSRITCCLNLKFWGTNLVLG